MTSAVQDEYVGRRGRGVAGQGQMNKQNKTDRMTKQQKSRERRIINEEKEKQFSSER